jgi:uncharacterized lipoprotein YbaY
MLVAGEGLAPFRGARIRVRLLDVTYQDAAAKVVAEQLLDDVSYDGAGGEIAPFSLTPSAIDPRAHYTVAAEIEHDEPDRGIVATKQSFPVLTHGYGDHVAVKIHELG